MSQTNDDFINRLSNDFAQVYANERPQFLSRASGRVELIGGHTDYNEGYVIAAAIDRSCYVAAAAREDNAICLYSDWVRGMHEFDLTPDLRRDENSQWANYGRGVAALLLAEGIALKGANLYIHSEVPLGAGVSSSAALEVSLANAMLAISSYDGQIKSERLAQICQKAENTYANSPCGIMDQTVSIMGQADHAVFLDCRDVSIRLLPFDHNRCSIMIFNSMVRHEVGGGEYGKRRASCEKARDVIAKKYPHVKALRDADEQMLNSVAGELSDVELRRASHVIAENARVLAAAKALDNNDVARFGRLMSASHNSARDLYEISCDETDFLAESIQSCEGAYGARIMGGGFGGAVVALARPDATEKIADRVRPAYKDAFDIECESHIAKPSKGTDTIRLEAV
jgi:galactokinase